ncbi:MAG: pkb-activating kinase-like protein [Candelina mexicana]|nr:MAG: pkb-activating kinase-like protein [Candelina mexicana]
MDGDLSLSQSLGGLRIANPDDSVPTSPVEAALDPKTSVSVLHDASSLSTIKPVVQQAPQLTPSLIPNSTLDREPSPLGFNAESFSTSSQSITQSSPPIPHETLTYAQRNSHRQSMPLSYQAQQQAQFPSHSSPMQQQQQRYPLPPIGSARPTSILYQQSPQNMSNGHSLTREGSYRQKNDYSRPSVAGMPRRSSSRGASAAMHSGVTSRERGHSDRAYRESQQFGLGNGQMPPRRSSRGVNGGTLPAETSVSAVSSSGPPHNLDDGPLPSSEEWKDRGAAMGVRQDQDPSGRRVLRSVKKGVKDFKFGRTLGEGSYSTVLAAVDRQTLTEYAIKVLDKKHIIKEKKVKYVNIERDTLNRLTDHPGVVRLYYTFQDEFSLYFVLDLATGGELLGVLKKTTTFDEDCTRFYGAQILDTVSYMHAKGVIHRDLKPENVLLDERMHVKITDFGTAKILEVPKRLPKEGNDAGIPLAGDPMDGADDDRANSFVGTAEYVSPELLTDKNACKASDLWAFGCIIYQLLAGRPPFKAGNEYQTFQKIVALDYEFPKGFPEVARDLVERLLVLDPSKRLSIEHIKNHQFFDGMTWGRDLWKQKAPRLKSYSPPPQEPIKLNSSSSSNAYSPPFPQHNGSKAALASASQTSNGIPRPSPRVITELPPPSQLDIEWSPVLTKSNERILKLGNLMVTSAPAPHSPNTRNGPNGDTAVETPKRFSRFFGGSTTKKRQRLVMVTSSARIIMAAAGGDEKKTKTEVSLLGNGCSVSSLTDVKGFTCWLVNTREKLYTFEDIKPSSSDPPATKKSADEWLDTIDRAKELTISHSMTNSYSSHDAFKDLPSSLSSRTISLGDDVATALDNIPSSSGRLTKSQQGGAEAESSKGRRRFSKRQSKGSLAAVF